MGRYGSKNHEMFGPFVRRDGENEPETKRLALRHTARITLLLPAFPLYASKALRGVALRGAPYCHPADLLFVTLLLSEGSNHLSLTLRRTARGPGPGGRRSQTRRVAVPWPCLRARGPRSPRSPRGLGEELWRGAAWRGEEVEVGVLTAFFAPRTPNPPKQCAPRASRRRPEDPLAQKTAEGSRRGAGGGGSPLSPFPFSIRSDVPPFHRRPAEEASPSITVLTRAEGEGGARASLIRELDFRRGDPSPLTMRRAPPGAVALRSQVYSSWQDGESAIGKVSQ